MTGFGAGGAQLDHGRVVAEVRSVNHRFLEVRVRLPNELTEHSFFVEQRCRERLSRGRCDVTVRLEQPMQGAGAVDVERAKALYATFARLRDEVAPGTELPVTVLAAVPQLLTATPTLDTERVRGALSAALDNAVSALDTMRTEEGEKLKEELEGRLDRVEALRRQIEQRSPELVTLYRTRLKERLEKLLEDAGAPLDPGRLEAEVALLADKSDVTEELVRLKSHFSQFAKLLASGEAIGRRLDFLLQEIGRETNTIGAKCLDAELSHVVVELKAEVEKMREQVQNVE